MVLLMFQYDTGTWDMTIFKNRKKIHYILIAKITILALSVVSTPLILLQSNKINWKMLSKCRALFFPPFFLIPPHLQRDHKTPLYNCPSFFFFFLISNQYPLPPSVYFESVEQRWILVGSLYCERSVISGQRMDSPGGPQETVCCCVCMPCADTVVFYAVSLTICAF